MINRYAFQSLIVTLFNPFSPEYFDRFFIQVFNRCSRTNTTRKIKACFIIYFATNCLGHREFGLPYKYPEAVEIAASKLPTDITPEEIAACAESYTGMYLKRVLEG